MVGYAQSDNLTGHDWHLDHECLEVSLSAEQGTDRCVCERIENSEIRLTYSVKLWSMGDGLSEARTRTRRVTAM